MPCKCGGMLQRVRGCFEEGKSIHLKKLKCVDCGEQYLY